MKTIKSKEKIVLANREKRKTVEIVPEFFAVTWRYLIGSFDFL